MSNEASRKAFEAWHAQRAAEIISNGKVIAQKMIADGYSDSGPTHNNALLTALEQADGTGRDAWNAGRKALEAEQAQAVEPVSEDSAVWCDYVAGMLGAYLGEQVDSDKCKAMAGIIKRRLWALTPPPEPTVKQPLSTERAALIARHRDVQESGINAEMRELAKTTSDMLEADAQWEKLRDPEILHVNLVRGLPAQLSKAQLLHLLGKDAQQVAVPAGYVPMTTAQLRKVYACVPYQENESAVNYLDFARAIEAAHGITPPQGDKT